MRDSVEEAIKQVIDEEVGESLVVTGLIVCLTIGPNGQEGISLLPMANTRPHEGLGLLQWANDQYLRMLADRTRGG